MEKKAVIDPKVTPTQAPATIKQAGGRREQIKQLDSEDLQKKLADTVANTLKKS